jgi:integrase
MERMNEMHSRGGEFVRVAENLYRYSSSGVYYARFRANSKEISRSLRTTDRAIAKRQLAEEMANASKIDAKLGKMTLEELTRLYDEHLSQFARKTVATRRSILKCFKRTWPHGLQIPVPSVNAGQLEMWLGRKRSGVKNATYNEYARFLRHLFDIALKHRVIAVSPAAELHGLRVEAPIRSTPTWEQYQSIVADIRAQKFNAEAEDSANLVEFMGLAGIGTAECANLNGEHIDIAGNRITLYRQKTDTGYAIPIFPQLLPFLERLKLKGQICPGKPVFAVKDPKKALAAACTRLGFSHFSPRSLRRCFITRAIELGIDFKTIASWQGHRDGGVLIAKTYSHLRNEHSDNMAKKLVM